MQKKTLFLVFLCFCFPFACFADWYAGFIHGPHTPHSDGKLKPRDAFIQAEAAGASFDCFSDHYRGIKDFVKYYEDLKSQPGLITLVGTELSAGYEDHNSHTIGIGRIQKDEVLDSIEGKAGSQQAIIDRLHQRGMLAAAAHPSAITAGSLQSPPTDPTNYFYDRANANGIDGIEFGNEPVDRSKITFAWYLSLIAKNKDVFAFFGNDSHYLPIDKDETQRWQRKNYVYVDGPLSEGSLFEAIKAGHIYGARDNISLENLNFVPGFAYQSATEARFQFRIRFPEKSSKREIRLFRDGNPAPCATVSIPKGMPFFDCNLFDEGVTGKHTYIIAMDDLSLVTSPFRLEIGSPQVISGDLVGKFFSNVRIQRYNEKDAWLHGGYAGSGYTTAESDPVPNAQDSFVGPAFLEIYVIFKNKMNAMGEVVCKFAFVITSPSGERITQNFSSFSNSGSWEQGWVVFHHGFNEKGKYTIQIMDINMKKTVASRNFTIR